MTPWMRKIHTWIGLLIGIQLVLWMCSGLVMSLLDSASVRGAEFRAARKAIVPAWPRDTLPAEAVLAAAALPVHAIATGWLADRPIYKLASEQGISMVDARRGQPVAVAVRGLDGISAHSRAERADANRDVLRVSVVVVTCRGCDVAQLDG